MRSKAPGTASRAAATSAGSLSSLSPASGVAPGVSLTTVSCHSGMGPASDGTNAEDIAVDIDQTEPASVTPDVAHNFLVRLFLTRFCQMAYTPPSPWLVPTLSLQSIPAINPADASAGIPAQRL